MEYKDEINPVRELSKSFRPKRIRSNWMIRDRVKPPERKLEFVAVFDRNNEFVCRAASKGAAQELCRENNYWYEVITLTEEDLQREERSHRENRVHEYMGVVKDLTHENEFEGAYNYV